MVTWDSRLPSSQFFCVSIGDSVVRSCMCSRSVQHQGQGAFLWFHLRVPMVSEKASQSAPKWAHPPLHLNGLFLKSFQIPLRGSCHGPLLGCRFALSAAKLHAMILRTAFLVQRPPHPHVLQHRLARSTVIKRLSSSESDRSTGLHKNP